jgi:hypothetical protein
LGDFRLAHLLATTLAGGLIAFTRPMRHSSLAGALFLFTPRGFFVLEAGWTEPLAVMLLAGVIFAACRRWRIMPVLLTLLFVVKQYLLLAAPLALVLLILPSLRQWQRSTVSKREEEKRVPDPLSFMSIRICHVLRHSRIRVPDPLITLPAVLAPCAVTLPLALWDVRAFIHSVVTLQFHQPLRMDALSYLPWMKATFGIAPTWIAFVAAAGIIVWAIRRFPRTPAGFAMAVAITFSVFYVVTSHAVGIHVMFALAALVCAGAAV